jgi:hypothetical protein
MSAIYGFCMANRGAKLGEQTVVVNDRSPWTVFTGFGEHELGKMRGA